MPTRFVGREAALRSLADAVRRAPLVTVLGPPGTGKTRLVVEYARRLSELEPDSPRAVFFADLSEATTLEGTVARVAAALGVELTDAPEPAGALALALAQKGPALLILDNFEQIVRVASHFVEALVERAPDTARFVVTSRERLAIACESLLDLGPLALPSGAETSSEAVELFLDRARAADHSFDPSEAELHDVAQLVRLLDGLPLAIELAAARMRVLAPGELIERLTRRFEVLTIAPSTLRSRHATLRETIEASSALLSPHERAALGHICVFRGGFNVRAAEAVLDLSAHEDAPSALDVVQSLRDKSLVVERRPEGRAAVSGGPPGWSSTDNLAPSSGPRAGERRFTLLVSIREFGEASLSDAERAAAEERHARYFLGLGRELGARLDRSDDAAARVALRLEHENFLAVHERFLRARATCPADLANASLEAALIVSRSAAAFPYAASIAVLDAALRSGDATSPLFARALLARGNLQRFVGMVRESAADLERVIELARGDDALTAAALAGLGNTLTVSARFEEASALFERALELLGERGDVRERGRVLLMLAAAWFNRDEPERARALLERGISLARESGDRAFEGVGVTSLGIVSLATGALSAARSELDEALRIHREVAARHWEGVTLAYAALVEQEAGRGPRAAELHQHALALISEMAVRRAEGLALAGYASWLWLEGRRSEALERYRKALDLSRRMSPDHEGLLFACIGALAAEDGDLTTASDAFEAARRALAPFARPAFRAAIDVHEAQLDLARARAENDAARRAAHVEAARARAARAEPWLARSHDVRLARVLCDRALAGFERTRPGAEEAALVVGPDGTWFRLPRAKASVRLHRRRALARLVAGLVSRHESTPGEAVRINELVAFGWPGERVLPEAGTERVYTAIATLRKLGLRKLLLSRDDGYLLDPAIPVVRETGPG
ncbi:MAG: tetratricopeptide repeat protein [Polyangiaceae bacterium]